MVTEKKGHPIVIIKPKGWKAYQSRGGQVKPSVGKGGKKKEALWTWVVVK